MGRVLVNFAIVPSREQATATRYPQSPQRLPGDKLSDATDDDLQGHHRTLLSHDKKQIQQSLRNIFLTTAKMTIPHVIVAAIDPKTQQKPIDDVLQDAYQTYGSAKTCSLLCATSAAVGQKISRRSCDATRVQGC